VTRGLRPRCNHRAADAVSSRHHGLWLVFEPTGPILVPYAFGGGPRLQFSRRWAWPLPPPGALQFVCEWPTFEIIETRAGIGA